MIETDDLPSGVQDCVELLRDRDYTVQFITSLGGTRIVADRCEEQVRIAQVSDVWRLTIRDPALDERVRLDGDPARIRARLRRWMGLGDEE